jgi:hypothetical protein
MRDLHWGKIAAFALALILFVLGVIVFLQLV